MEILCLVMIAVGFEDKTEFTFCALKKVKIAAQNIFTICAYCFITNILTSENPCMASIERPLLFNRRRSGT